MATVDLQGFIKDRLLALDSSIDVSPGSPAQVEFIAPILTYLGADPFETDIDSFLTDRFRQEYPDIYASDPSAIRDAFVKPLILFLEPFKREIQLIKRNQSLQDPTVLSDADADALLANIFDERPSGGFSQGVVRCYFSSPTNVPVELTVKFFTAGGLNFFPVVPSSTTAEEMVFNRQGSLYYMDVVVKAEKSGAQYNIDAGDITGQIGLYGVVRVTNLSKFQYGVDEIDTPTFVSQARESLNERSLVTRRGATARITDTFKGQVRAVQVIGANDPEMKRDLLVGTSGGHAWLTGRVTMYENLALVQCRTVDDSVESGPSVGDVLYVYLSPAGWPNLRQPDRMQRLRVEEVIGPPFPGGAGFQVAFVVRWSGALPGGVAPRLVSEGGFIRNNTLRISSLPGIGVLDTEPSVAGGSVHVFGHTDIYVRPVSQDVSASVLSSIVDENPILERTTLTSVGGTNIIGDSDSSFDFVAAGVLPGDVLSIENGDDAGTYVVGAVAQDSLSLSTNLSKPATDLRYRVSRTVTINPFDPKIPKLPFAYATAADLQTVIGTNLFLFTINTLDFGVKIGDIVRVKSGLDKGDFTIVGFDAALGGLGVLVDRNAGGSDSNLTYEIFTPLEKVELPLVRLRELLLLDSAQKSTGIAIPPADPVAVIPTSDFTTAQTRGRSYLQSGFVLPAFRSFINPSSVSADFMVGNDCRYSQDSEDRENGIWKAVRIDTVRQYELLFPQSALDTCSWFVMTVEDDTLADSMPPVVVKVGDALEITSGPNKGGYLVKDVRKFRYVDVNTNKQTIYLIQIHGEFPVDAFSYILNFLETTLTTAGQSSFLDPLRAQLDTKPYFPDFFSNFYASIGSAFYAALTILGTSAPTSVILQAAANNVLSCSYTVGAPARGVLRSYFLQPTLFQQNTADASSPTLYDFTTPSGEVVSFRADPSLYPEHILLPARGTSDPDSKSFLRDAVIGSSGEITFSTSDKPTLFALDIRAGDVLSLHEEVFLYGDVQLVTAVKTTQDSPRVVAAAGDSPFTTALVGSLLAIEEGDDAGMYYVTDVPDSKTLTLDRSLTVSTPTILATGVTTSWGMQDDKSVVHDPTINFTAYVGKWVTLFHIPANVADNYYQGSFRIVSIVDQYTVEVDIGSGTWPYLTSGGMVLVTDAPAVDPTSDSSTTGATEGVGTQLVGARPIRVYQETPTEYPVLSVLDDPVTSRVTVQGSPVAGLRQPYSFRRAGIRRVNPMEMSQNQDGALYYFDTEAVSLASKSSANIPRGSYLTAREGTYYSQGYRHHVADPTLSYSMKESGTLELPISVLPAFVEDRRDNEISIVGAPLQVSHERADLVSQLQAFLDSAEDRVTAANMLARHFLPAYFSYDANYYGGSAASVIAQDIIDYVNTLPIETPIDVSELEKMIDQRGGNPITPTTAIILIHDWSRRVWAEFSQDQLGGIDTNVPYDGTPRVSYFVPGPDASGQTDPAAGERINLSKVIPTRRVGP